MSDPIDERYWRFKDALPVKHDGRVLAWAVSWYRISSGSVRWFVYRHAALMADRVSIHEAVSEGYARAWARQHSGELIADLRRRELWPAREGLRNFLGEGGDEVE